MGIYEKLVMIQGELKAPKGQFNNYGGYKYRSCEDILEAVKPLLVKYNAALTISDSVELIGTRYYIKATARLADTENGETIENTAYAREAEVKKGMDDSQITGTASSYARKYALNGLFCIDDTKDADTEAYTKTTSETKEAAKKITKPMPITKAQVKKITELSQDINTILKYYKITDYTKVTPITVEFTAYPASQIEGFVFIGEYGLVQIQGLDR